MSLKHHIFLTENLSSLCLIVETHPLLLLSEDTLETMNMRRRLKILEVLCHYLSPFFQHVVLPQILHALNVLGPQIDLTFKQFAHNHDVCKHFLHLILHVHYSCKENDIDLFALLFKEVLAN